MAYVELHAASAFSFLRGASLPEELAAAAAELGMPALALLDADGMYGAPRFHQACRNAGVRALLGAEITLEDQSRLPVLAASRAGYRTLCRMLSRMHLRAPRKGAGRLAWSELEELTPGLVALSGDEDGPLAAALARGGEAEGRRGLERLQAAFGRDNVYVELQRHFRREEEPRNEAAIRLAVRLGLPCLATNGVRYASPAGRTVLDVFTCLRHHTRLDQAGRRLAPNAERFLKPARAMEQLFADCPAAVANTGELAARLQFSLENLGYRFPQPDVPEGHTPDSWLRQLAEAGARRRYQPLHDRARRQIHHELAIIGKLGLAGYFLILEDIVRYCRRQGILAQGRGSAANSAVCYSLGITAVDPVGMDLLFERFLSEERGEWPDIDMDLPSGERREQVIQYVYARYGGAALGAGAATGAAMTANVITYRGRSAAREIGKVLDFPEEAVATLSRVLGSAAEVLQTPSWRQEGPPAGATRFPPASADIAPPVAQALQQAGFDTANRQILRFLYLCQAVQDLPRHLGQHSGGMVLCAGPLAEIVPLEKASMPQRVVIQWDKEDCAALGLIKVDLLGLGMMAALQEALLLVRDRLPRARQRGVFQPEEEAPHPDYADLDWLPPEDPAVYRALRAADTVGVFQVESRAQMATLPRLRPRCFYDLVIEVAIIRPGPITGDLVNPYLRRRNGEEAATCAHPLLEPILRRTLGVPLFQEQLLKMAMVVAGFTPGQAEQLRRAMGFKRSQQRMAPIEGQLRAGMRARGIAGPAADEIVRSITSFALYGFPESHAASFALLVYASAYLKVHFPAEFLCALLNQQPMGFYHPATLIQDARRHGVRMLPISVADSDWNCTVVADPAGRAVRLGLRYVTGLRAAAAQRLVAERAARPFISLEDFFRRVPLERGEARTLADIGALASFGSAPPPHGARECTPEYPTEPERPGAPRSGALGQANEAMRRLSPRPLHGARRAALWQAEASSRSPGDLFASLDQPGMEGETASPLAEMTARERMAADFAGTGVTLGPHPIAFDRARLQALGVAPAAALPRLRPGPVAVAGVVIARQRPENAGGVMFLSLEDETGIANIVVWPRVFERQRLAWITAQQLWIHGRLQRQNRVVHVIADQVRPLAELCAEPRPALFASHDFR
ncbi:MAG: DNA polymerase III subunit alpha [Terriglobales bacterium]